MSSCFRKIVVRNELERGEHVQLDSPFSVPTTLKIVQAIEVHNLVGECFKNIILKVSWTLKGGGEEVV